MPGANEGHTRHSVLIVEDDPVIAGNLFSYLEAGAFVPDCAHDASTAIYLLETHPFDAMILDIGLPGMDGYRVLSHVREELRLDLPVLILTARDSLSDKATGFSLGADDFLTKPLAMAEVEMRLRARLRRAQPAVAQGSTLRCGALSYDTRARVVTVADGPLRLTRKCLQILELLMRHQGSVVSRATLEQHLWQGEPPSSDALRSQLHLLRKALLEAGFDGIRTVHGLGWRLSEDAL